MIALKKYFLIQILISFNFIYILDLYNKELCVIECLPRQASSNGSLNFENVRNATFLNSFIAKVK